MIYKVFYTIFNNVDLFKVFKWIVIFIVECVALYLGFLGLACFFNPDIVDRSFVISASFRNNCYVYLPVIFLSERIRNMIGSTFFDRKISYISGSTIERIKKIKAVYRDINSAINEVIDDSDYIIRFYRIILKFLLCFSFLFLLCIAVFYMYAFFSLCIDILMI